MLKGQLTNRTLFLKCRKCQRLLPRMRFIRYTTKTGTRSWTRVCHRCHNEKGQAWKKRNREKYLPYMRAYKDLLRKDGRRHGYHIKATYGITSEQYHSLMSKQRRKCALCYLPERAKASGGKYIRPLAVDHNARTGHVRGLLCFQCNVMLGKLERVGVLKVMSYLKRKK